MYVLVEPDNDDAECNVLDATSLSGSLTETAENSKANDKEVRHGMCLHIPMSI